MFKYDEFILMLSAVVVCCSYPKKPGGEHSERRDEGRLGRRRLVVHTDPKVVPDLEAHVSHHWI